MLKLLNGDKSKDGGNGNNGPKEFVKWVFKYMSVYESNIMNALGYIKNNYPSKTIARIDAYLFNVSQLLDGSNDIDITINVLTSFKKYLSWFSVDSDNYITKIRDYLIHPLSRLTIADSTISMIQELETSVPRIKEIKDKYESIKPKVSWCKSSLEFEVKRLESISANAKLLENHLGSIITILKKYKTIEDKLKELKKKLDKLKEDKSNSISHLKNISYLAIFYLNKIQCISQDLSLRINCVSIMTINQDIQSIKSEIEAVQNIVASVQSELSSLANVEFGVDCQTVNEIESCIKEIVCCIHKKYCSLSTITSELKDINECKSLTSGASCDLSRISQCTGAQTSPQGSNSCQSCGTSTVSQDCQCCQSITQCLNQLKSLATSSGPNIEKNLKCIKKVVCKLTDDKTSDGCKDNSTCSTTVTCPASSQCPTTGATCETVQPQAATTCQQGGTKTGCDSQGGEVKKVIKCIIDEIKIVEDNVKTGMIRV